jgi:type VI secretion system secreted protein VgrG
LQHPPPAYSTDEIQGMLYANAAHITLTLEGANADLQALSFTRREASTAASKYNSTGTAKGSWNPGINIALGPDIAKKIVHLVAKNERRYNFSLNSAGAADIILPGVHSDLGGGYLPKATEKVLISKPRRSDVERRSMATEANS